MLLDQSLVALRHQLLDLSDTIRYDSQTLVRTKQNKKPSFPHHFWSRPSSSSKLALASFPADGILIFRCFPASLTHLVPFGVDLLRGDGGVGVGTGHVHMIGLHNLGYLVVDPQDGLAFLVGVGKCCFELLVS